MCQLFDSLIDEKLTLNQFKEWFELSTNDQKLLENTSKYELITYLLTNIRLSIDWLNKTTIESTVSQNCVPKPQLICDNLVNYKSKDNKLSANIGNNNNNKSKDNFRNVFKTENSSQNKCNNKLNAVKELTQNLSALDLNDENVFPELSCRPPPTNGHKSASIADQQSVTNTEPSLNSAQSGRRTKRIKPTTIRGDDKICVGFFTTGRKEAAIRTNRQMVRKEFFGKSEDTLVVNRNQSEGKPNSNANSNNKLNDSLSAEREWLKRAKASADRNKSFGHKTPQTNECAFIQEVVANRLVAIEANHNCVTFGPQLDLISNIYALILNTHFVANFFAELNLICHLISKPVHKEHNDEAIGHPFDKYLSSYHNCMYFSVKCLELMLSTNGLMYCLNKTFLKQITDSSLVITFAPNFRQKLQSVIEWQQKSLNQQKANESPFVTTLESILFQSETDNKSQFPNDQSFHTFRRQRDEFYLIFNSYRNRNNGSNVQKSDSTKDYQKLFASKVKHLLSLSTDSANLYHLCRLFVSQLLQTCVYKHLNANNGNNSNHQNRTRKRLL